MPSKSFFRLHFLTSACLLACASAQAASGVPQSYDVPAQPLSASLLRIADEGATPLSLDADLVRGLPAPAVRGQLTPEAALRQALAGSGLDLQRTGSGILTVRKVQTQAADAAGEGAAAGQALATVTVKAVAEGERATTEGSGRYTPRATSAATGLVLAPRETPQSLEVVTRQRIEDQAVHSLSEVLRTTTGVAESSYDSERSSFSYRGFNVDNYLYDGVATTFSSPYAAGESELDAAIYDRVEIIRGATGLLTGSGNPGGSVNLVRKRASSRQLTGEVSVSAGSWDNYRSDVDVSTPLNAEASVRGRFVAAGQRAHTFQDHQEKNKQLFFATVEADLTPATVLRLGADHQENRPKGSSWGGVPIWFTNGEVINWDRSTNLAPSWNHWSTTTKTAFVALDHALDNGWKTHIGFASSKQSYDAQLAMALGNVAPGSYHVDGQPYSYWYRGQRAQDAMDAKAEGKFTLFGREHEAVFGASASRQKQLIIGARALDMQRYAGSLLDWNGALPIPAWGEPYVESDIATRENGLYGAVRLSLTDPLKLIVGARYSSWERKEIDKFTHFTPYAGAVYDFGNGLSAYASYTNIFKPQDAQDRNGSFLEPIVGKSREVGVKAASADNRLNAAFSVFNILQDNLAQADTEAMTPDGLNQAYYGAKGANSKGLEFEVSGEILPGWNAKLGYTHYNIKDQAGKELNTTLPRSIFDLFTTYSVAATGGKLIVGGGLRYQGDIWGLAWGADGSGSVLQRRSEQASYTLVNLMARYEFTPQTSLQVNLNNAFDRNYLTQLNFYQTKSYGTPRNLLLTLVHRY